VALPRLKGDLTALRAELTTKRQARVEAEQRAAVLAVRKADLESRLAEAKQSPSRHADQAQTPRTKPKK
jgi:hypothetical protein